jgi:hypothetical protein
MTSVAERRHGKISAKWRLVTGPVLRCPGRNGGIYAVPLHEDEVPGRRATSAESGDPLGSEPDPTTGQR